VYARGKPPHCQGLPLPMCQIRSLLEDIRVATDRCVADARKLLWDEGTDLIRVGNTSVSSN
jgi:hypothetical protein